MSLAIIEMHLGLIIFERWHGVTMGIALDVQSIGRRFKSYSAMLPNNLGQVVHTHVPLSPNSVTWYRPKGGDALRLGR